MKEFFFVKFNFKEKYLYILLLLSFLTIAYYHLSSTIYMAPDSYRYSRWADELIKLNFNLYDYFSLEKSAIRPHLFFVSVPVYLMALCKFFFVNEWQFGFLLINLLFLFFSLIIFVKSLLLVGIRPIIIALTLPLIVISVDILIWPRYILSDMIYAFLVVLATYYVIKGIVINKISYIGLLFTMVLLLATRPTAMPVISAIICFVVISKYQIFLKPKIILIFLSTIFISIPFIFSLLFLLIENNFNENAKLYYVVNMVNMGMIIHDRPETWVSAPSNFIDITYIYFLRLINFFNPHATTFSMIHNVLNMAQTLIIFLSLFIWLYFGSPIKFYSKIFFFIIMLSIFVSAFHSFTLIDYDWRYRFPIILPLIMLVPISLEIFFKKLIKID